MSLGRQVGFGPPARWLVVLAALLPPLVLATWLFGSVGDNPCHDEGLVLTEFLGRVLAPGYHWRGLLRDTFFVSHAALVPCLVILGDSLLRGLHIPDLLAIGLLLAGLRLWLLHCALTRGLENSPWARASLWPVLSALVFAPSLVSTFESMHTLTVQLSSLGRDLAVFALARLSGLWRGALLISAGALLACYSNADGPVVSAVLLAATMLPPWRFRHRALVLTAVLLGAAPYAALEPASVPGPGLSPFPFVLNTLGRLLARGAGGQYLRLPAAEVAALIGIGLAACGLLLLLRHRRAPPLAQLTPSLVLMSTSIAVCVELSLFRRTVAPWQTAYALGFWLGLLGLAWQLMWSDPAEGIAWPVARRWAALTMATIAGLYAASNLTLEDKTFFRRLRSPAAASCLRAYRTAPTHCQQVLHPRSDSHPEFVPGLGRLLESYRLSVLGPHQRWALQGDVILGAVRFEEHDGVPPVAWLEPGTVVPASFRDPRALDLLVHAPNAVAWTVTLPRVLRRADFCSAVALAAGVPSRPPADGVTAQVVVEPQGEAPYIAFSSRMPPGETRGQPFCIPLLEQAGRSITLSLRSVSGPTNTFDWAVYRYPHIELERGPEDAADGVTASVPGNTELSSSAPQPGPADAVFAMDSAHWRVGGERAPTALPEWARTAGAYFEWTEPVDLPLDDYSSLWVRGVPPDFSRMLRVQWEVTLPGGQRTELEIWVPYLGDEGAHAYAYDLRLLELPRGSRLSAMRLHRGQGVRALAGLKELRLLRAGAPVAVAQRATQTRTLAAWPTAW